MFGFFIGTVSLVALIAVLSRRRHYGHWHHYRHRGWLYGALERLDTSPGQEKAIRAALSELRGEFRNLRDVAYGSRGEFAKAMRGDQFDRGAAAAAFATNESALGAARERVLETMGRIHEVLDERQRARLADWLESGHGYFGHGYAGCHC
jgi:Spy/CpxP family protein refolding chaperone